MRHIFVSVQVRGTLVQCIWSALLFMCCMFGLAASRGSQLSPIGYCYGVLIMAPYLSLYSQGVTL